MPFTKWGSTVLTDAGFGDLLRGLWQDVLAYEALRSRGQPREEGTWGPPPASTPQAPVVSPIAPSTPQAPVVSPTPPIGNVDIGNAPRPGENYPIATGPYWSPGSIYWGRSGPKKRFRRSQEAERRRKWRACIDADPTDTGVMLCDEAYGYRSDYVWPDDEQLVDQARGPMPVELPVPAPPAVATGALARIVLGTVVRTVGGVLGGVLWPSGTAHDDVVLDPAPLPQPLPRGPGQRPRIVTRPTPSAPTKPELPYVGPNPRPSTYPRPTSLPQDLPSFPAPSSVPRPTQVPLPAPSTPTSSPWFDPLLPLLLSPLLPLLSSPGAPHASPLTPTQPEGGTSPQPASPPTFPPNQSRDCDCQGTKDRKRKRKGCTNPVLRKRRGVNAKGQRTITTTRLLRCQV